MGCSISKSTHVEGVHQAQATACNPALPAQHQRPSQEIMYSEKNSLSKLLSKRETLSNDSANGSSIYSDKLRRRNTSFTRKSFSSASEESDVLTDDLSADPYESCDTQTDDEPWEEEETLTPAQMRDEKFLADRAASKVQRSVASVFSAARKKPKADKDEQAESRMIRMKARASRRRARIEQRKAELKAKRAHTKEHATLCDNYDNLVRLDKIHKTEKEESHYDCVRRASKEERDGKVDIAGKHIKEQTENNFVSRKRFDSADEGRPALVTVMDKLKDPADVVGASMQRLLRDLRRRASGSTERFSSTGHPSTGSSLFVRERAYVENSEIFLCRSTSSLMVGNAANTQVGNSPKPQQRSRKGSLEVRRISLWRQFSEDAEAGRLKLRPLGSAMWSDEGTLPHHSLSSSLPSSPPSSIHVALPDEEATTSATIPQLLSRSLRRRTFERALSPMTFSPWSRISPRDLQSTY